MVFIKNTINLSCNYHSSFPLNFHTMQISPLQNNVALAPRCCLPINSHHNFVRIYISLPPSPSHSQNYLPISLSLANLVCNS